MLVDDLEHVGEQGRGFVARSQSGTRRQQDKGVAVRRLGRVGRPGGADGCEVAAFVWVPVPLPERVQASVYDPAAPGDAQQLTGCVRVHCPGYGEEVLLKPGRPRAFGQERLSFVVELGEPA